MRANNSQRAVLCAGCGGPQVPYVAIRDVQGKIVYTQNKILLCHNTLCFRYTNRDNLRGWKEIEEPIALEAVHEEEEVCPM